MLMRDHVEPDCALYYCAVSAAHEAALAVCAEEGSWLPLLPVNAYGKSDTGPSATLSESTAGAELARPSRSCTYYAAH